MNLLSESEKLIAEKLQEIGVFKFGNFTLKSGQKSPVYIDLRVVVSSPILLVFLSSLSTLLSLQFANHSQCGLEILNCVKKRQLSEEVFRKIEQTQISFDCICGVPYAALPVATCLSVDHKLPMLVLRKETKGYGTGKQLEGLVLRGQKYLILEDTVTTGTSIIDAAKVLRNQGLEVNDVIVVLDRYQGASAELAKRGLRLHSIFSLPAILQYFCETDKITECTLDEIVKFLSANQVVMNGNGETHPLIKPPFDERSCLLKHPRALMLAGIIKLKKTNLCLSADLTDAQAILHLVSLVGQEICLLKLHSDAIVNFSEKFVVELKKYAENMNFMIMEDRKFGDTGNTVRMQLTEGPTRISNWAHFVTVHAVAGSGTLLGLKDVCLDKNIGCLLVCEMSSADALCNTEDYRSRCLELAKQHKDLVAGFICQKKLPYDDDSFLFVTPDKYHSKTLNLLNLLKTLDCHFES